MESETFDVHFRLRARPHLNWTEPIARPVTDNKVALAVTNRRADGKRLFKASAIAVGESDYGGLLWAHGVLVGDYFIDPGSRRRSPRK